MMPHLGEELWERLGYSGYLVDQPWPNADAALASDERAVLAVQVNGKKRATITLPVDSAEDVARSAALAEPAVQRAMDGKAARSEEHTSELQSLMRISYAVFCLDNKIRSQRWSSPSAWSTAP